MTPEEQLDEARAEEAYRQWREEGCQGDDTIDVATIAARLAREGWITEAINRKMLYNEIRADHSRSARASEHGKKY